MDAATKQVIVIRRNLGMRRGKEIAQGSHASMAFLTRRLETRAAGAWPATLHYTGMLELSRAEYNWLQSSFAKIVCQVPDEAGLLRIYDEAKAAGLEAHLITDSGRTEFGGVPTLTAVAIGPDYNEKIDAITGGLELY